MPAEYGVPRTLARLEALPRRPPLRDRGTAALTAARPAPGPIEAAAAAAWADGLRSLGSPPPSLSPCDRAQVLPRAASAAASRERAAPEQGGLPPAAPPPSGGQGALSAVEQHGAAARPGMHPGLRRLHLPRVAAPNHSETERHRAYSRAGRGANAYQCASARVWCTLAPCTLYGMYDRETKTQELSRGLRASAFRLRAPPFPYVSFSLVLLFVRAGREGREGVTADTRRSAQRRVRRVRDLYPLSPPISRVSEHRGDRRVLSLRTSNKAVWGGWV